MKPRDLKRIFLSLLLSGILALETAVAADVICLAAGHRLSHVLFAAVVAAALALYLLVFRRNNRARAILCGALLVCGAAVVLGSMAICGKFQKDARYMDVDRGKQGVYGQRNVMVIVPHQDDEFNILGGAIEEFVNYGSTVRIVYTTNGDKEVGAELRYRDALEYCAAVGIPGENVIFLGYGDQWADGQPDIYNAPDDQVLTSIYGASATYGTQNHAAYRENKAYTRDNFLGDLADVILEYRPEVIFCVDYDDHIGHKSTSLSFERVMGQLLREHPDYRPTVYKGYAYGTAWFAQNDYYSLNMISTTDLYGDPYYQSPVSYHWDQRARFPVDAGILSRSVLNSGGYDSLLRFASQPGAAASAPGIVNGDKVFWQRRTDSLSLDARIEASSADPSVLQDFLLVDNQDLVNRDLPFDGVWIPESGDTEKTVTVTLARPGRVETVVLYDHPSPDHNVTQAEITLDDGTRILTGPLYAEGAATRIPVGKDGVTSFAVRLITVEGEMAGLTEIEVFSQPSQGDLAFVKLVNENGDFAYDHWVERGDTACFSLYRYGDLPQAEVTVSTDDPAVSAQAADGVITVGCPRGKAATVTVSLDGTDIADSIYVRNPGPGKTLLFRLGQGIENFANFRYGQLGCWWYVVRLAKLVGIAL